MQKMVKSKLKQVLSTPRDEAFVMLITGRRGSGKTTLLARLMCARNAWKGKYDKIIVISPRFI